MKQINYLDLFSGVGGFAKALQQAGVKIKSHFFSEINKHAIAVYRHQFKNAKYVGDVRTVSRKTITKRIDLITFGFPCQDVSNAGNRAGLSGARSGLFYEAIRIVEAFKPPVFVFENVDGLLFNNEGKDFEVVLQTIANLGIYDCEWQLLDTSWLLPQSRKRIYFVGHLRGKSRPEVFPFTKNDRVFNKKRGAKHTFHSLTATDCNGPSKQRDNVIAIPIGNPDRKVRRQNGRRIKNDGEDMFTLTTQDRHGVYDGYNWRRLTPLESERLDSIR